jgi:hypothetical protein
MSQTVIERRACSVLKTLLACAFDLVYLGSPYYSYTILIEHPCHPPTGEGRIHFRRQALPRASIDHTQHANRASGRNHIVNEMQSASLRNAHWSSLVRNFGCLFQKSQRGIRRFLFAALDPRGFIRKSNVFQCKARKRSLNRREALERGKPAFVCLTSTHREGPSSA